MIRVDAHQHFWTVARDDYGWLTAAEFPRLYRDMLPEHLAPQLSRSGVDRTVVVQAAQTEAETRYLLQLARETDFVAGVVGWSDLEAGDAPARIEALARESALLGLRPMLQDIADDAWLLRASVAPAVRAMVRTGLRFDALVKPRHLPVLRRFLDLHRDLPVVVDHGAKPAIGTDPLEGWARAMRDIGRNTHAYCKLSGLVTEAPRGWRAQTLAPYVDVLLDAFGPRRLMWGSDWPVMLEGYADANAADAYADWRTIAESLVAGATAEDRDWIFGGAAAAFYGIGAAPRAPARAA